MSKKRKFLIALVALSGIIVVGLGIHFKPESPELTKVADYAVKSDGMNFEIDLASNATTGYSWSARDVDEQYYSLDDIVYQAYPSKNVHAGSGGYCRLVGKVKKAGQSQFNLIYCRDWDSGKPKLTYRVTISSTKTKISKIKLTEMSE